MKKIFTFLMAVCLGIFGSSAYQVTIQVDDAAHLPKVGVGTPTDYQTVNITESNTPVTVEFTAMNASLFLFPAEGYAIESVTNNNRNVSLTNMEVDGVSCPTIGMLAMSYNNAAFVVTTKEEQEVKGVTYTLTCEQDVIEFTFNEGEIDVDYSDGAYTVTLPVDVSNSGIVTGTLKNNDYIIDEVTIVGSSNHLGVNDNKSFNIQYIIYNKDTNFTIELAPYVPPTIITINIDNTANIARIFTASGTFEWTPADATPIQYNVSNGTELGIKPADDCSIVSVMAGNTSVVESGYTLPATGIIYIDLAGLAGGSVVNITSAEPKQSYIITVVVDDSNAIEKIGLGSRADQTYYSKFVNDVLEIEVEKDYPANYNLFIYPAEGFGVSSIVFVGYGSPEETTVAFTENPESNYISTQPGQLATLLDKAVYFTTYTDTSGVEIIENGSTDNVIYNMQGVRVNSDSLQPGIYIVNGKKVAIR